MNRRNFLRTAAPAASVPFLLSGMPLSAMAETRLWRALARSESEDDRVLVLIQLNGGNDGLNTLVPLDQYANLSRTRSVLMITENKLLNITDNNAFHPKMRGFQELFETEKLGIIQETGYPDPNFSHFRSTDIWTSASSSRDVVTSGWLGRYFYEDHPDFPTGYPNDDFPDPLALTIGSTVSQTCQGPIANMGMAVENPNSFYDLIGDSQVTDDVPDTPAGVELTYIRQVMRQTNRYLDSVSSAYESGQNLSTKYPRQSHNDLGEQLRIVARLIAGGIRTKVFVVGIGGFDTHANQVENNQPTDVGMHATLLESLSQSVSAFQDDLEKLGVADRVLGMTFSEFGRRVQANGSYGSDHGTSAPMFVFGTKVNPMIHGTNPQIPDQVSVEFNLPMQHDFRSVYASVLRDWFGMDEADVSEVMLGDFPYIPILKGGNITTGLDEVPARDAFLYLYQNYPNPFTDMTRIRFMNRRPAQVGVYLFDGNGRKIIDLKTAYLSAGEHEVTLNGGRLRAGTYYCRLVVGSQQMVRKVVKV